MKFNRKGKKRLQSDLKQSRFRMWKSKKVWQVASSVLALLTLAGAGTVAVIQTTESVQAVPVNISDGGGEKVTELTSPVKATKNLPKGVKSITFGFSKPDGIADYCGVFFNDVNQYLDILDIQFSAPLKQGESITIPVKPKDDADNGEGKQFQFKPFNTSVPLVFRTADGSATVQIARTFIKVTANKENVTTISNIKNVDVGGVHNMSEAGNDIYSNIPTKKWKLKHRLMIGDATSTLAYDNTSSPYKDLIDVKTNYKLKVYENFSGLFGLSPRQHGQNIDNNGLGVDLSNGRQITRFYISGANADATSDVPGKPVDLKTFDGGETTYTIKPLENLGLTNEFSALNKTDKNELKKYIAHSFFHPLADQQSWGIHITEEMKAVQEKLVTDASFSLSDNSLTFKISRNKKIWDELTKVETDSILAEGDWTPQKQHLKEVAKTIGSKYYTVLGLDTQKFYRLSDPSQSGKSTLKVEDGKGEANVATSEIKPLQSQGSAISNMAGIYIKWGFVNEFGSWIDFPNLPSKTEYYQDGDSYKIEAPEYITVGKVQYHLVGVNTYDASHLLDPSGKYPSIASSGTISSDQYGQVFKNFFQYKVQKPARYNVVFRDVDVNAEVSGKTLASQYVEGPMLSQYDNSKAYEKTLKDLQKKGYVLKDQDSEVIKGSFDRETATFYVNLIHGRTTSKPNDDVNKKTITQTIKYVDEQGKPLVEQLSGKPLAHSENNVQVLQFQNEQTIDNVTHQVLQNNWNESQQTKAVKTPIFAGYKATSITSDKAIDKLNPHSTPNEVTAGTYKHDTGNQTITVKFAKIASRATVTFIDTDINAKTPNEVVTKQIIEGLQGQPYDNRSKYNELLESLKKKGYELVKADSGASKGTFITDNIAHPDEYYVYLKHGTTTGESGLTKDITQTIKYVDEKGKSLTDGNGTVLLSDNVQTLHFVQGEVTDNVTGQQLSTSWTDPQKTKAVKTPEVFGYSPEKVEGAIKNKNSTPENITEGLYSNTDKDETIIVKFKTHLARVNIVFRDVDLNASQANATLSALNFDGKLGQTYDHSKEYTEQLSKLQAKGYELIRADLGVDKGTFNHSDATLYVDLKHSSKLNKLEKTVTQTIKYVDEKGQKIPSLKPVVQIFKFTDTQTIDAVTGKVLRDEWSPDQQSKEIVSPKYSGFLPDLSKVFSKTYKHDSEDEVITVKYAPQNQKLHLKVVDSTGVKNPDKYLLDGRPLNSYRITLSGKTDQTYDNSQILKDLTTNLSKDGYAVVRSDSGAGKGEYDNDFNKDQTFYIVVKKKVDVTVIYRNLDALNNNSSPENLILATQKLSGVADENYDNSNAYEEQVNRLVKDGYYLVSHDDKALTGTYDSNGLTYYVDFKHINQVAKLTVKNSQIPVGSTFKLKDNFVSLIDGDGRGIDFSKVTVTGADKVDTSKAGVYRVTYTYKMSEDNMVSATAIVSVNPIQTEKSEAGDIAQTPKNSLSISAHDLVINQGETFNPEVLFDGAKDGDKTIDFKDVKVINTVDTSKAGKYEVTFTYTASDGRSSSVIATVTVKPSIPATELTPPQNIVPAVINSKDSTLWVNEKWEAKDNFVDGTDEFEKPLNFKDVKVKGTVDTTKVGVYKVTYSYTSVDKKTVSKTATITVKAPKIKTITHVVRYVDEKGKSLAPTVSKRMTFSEHPTEKENAWNATVKLPKVTSPILKGYEAPDKMQIDEQTYTSASNNRLFIVTYKKSKQKVSVIFRDLDEKDKEGQPKELLTERLEGLSGEVYKNEKYEADLKALLDKGYVLSKTDDHAQSGAYDADKNKDQVYYVDFKHQRTSAVSNVDKILTVSFVALQDSPDGKIKKDDKLSDSDHVQKLSFKKTTVTDDVSGKILSETFDKSSQVFTSKKISDKLKWSEENGGYVLKSARLNDKEVKLSDVVSDNTFKAFEVKPSDENIVLKLGYDYQKGTVKPEVKEPSASKQKPASSSSKKKTLNINFPETGESLALMATLSALGLALVAFAIYLKRETFIKFFNKKK